jgi:uncharacterized protein (TIGR03437 family)
VVGWGNNDDGQATTPAGLSGVVAISGGGAHSLALTSDGTVVGWGWNDNGQATPPAGLSGVVAISGGGAYSVALKSDGTVIGWGANNYGQTTPPAGLSGVVAIAAGGFHSLALTSDGTVVGWGDNSFGETTTPAGLSGVVAIAAGKVHSLALIGALPVLAPRISVEGITNAASFLAGPVAPGEIVSIFGADLGPTVGVAGGLNAQGRLETSVAGTQVFFDGVAAPLFYVRNDQVNLEVPYSVAGKPSVQVQVSAQKVLSNTVTVPVAATAPGIFAYSAGVEQAVMLNEDGSFNSPSQPARPGTIVVFWATGEGQTNPAGIDGKLAQPPYPAPVASVTLKIGGLPVSPIDYAASAPGFTGLMQINARVPPGVQPGNAVPVVLTIDGRDSQPGLTMVVGSNSAVSKTARGGAKGTFRK